MQVVCGCRSRSFQAGSSRPGTWRRSRSAAGSSASISGPAHRAGRRTLPSATTDASGRYRVALGSTAAGGKSTDNYVLAAAVPGDRGPGVSAEFRLNLPEHRAPTLTFWEPQVGLAIEPVRALVEFDALQRDDHDDELRYTITYLDAQGGVVGTSIKPRAASGSTRGCSRTASAWPSSARAPT